MGELKRGWITAQGLSAATPGAWQQGVKIPHYATAGAEQRECSPFGNCDSVPRTHFTVSTGGGAFLPTGGDCQIDREAGEI